MPKNKPESMLKFFKNIRRKSLSESKISKYLLYAIGEIVLVVIGILIAVSINNWNESRKDKRNLNQAYRQIQIDLQNDTLKVSKTITAYREKINRLTDIIQRNTPKSYYDSIDETNYSKCEKCIDDIAYADIFQNLDKGFQLFKLLNIQQSSQTDSLSFNIDTFYKTYESNFPDINSILLDLTNDKIDDNQKYDWFILWSDLNRKRYNKNFVNYIFESEEYRIKSARHLIYSKAYLNRLTDYKIQATNILSSLNKKLKRDYD